MPQTSERQSAAGLVRNTPDRRVGAAESCAVLAGCYVHIVQFGLLAGRWFGADDVACPAVMLASAGGASGRGRVPGAWSLVLASLARTQAAA